MPQLQNLWSEVQEKRDDVVFLCVNIGDEKEVIQKWWKEDGFTLQAMRQDGNAISSAFGVQYYPTNYLIGADGTITWRSVGYDEAAIREYLEL